MFHLISFPDYNVVDKPVYVFVGVIFLMDYGKLPFPSEILSCLLNYNKNAARYELRLVSIVSSVIPLSFNILITNILSNLFIVIAFVTPVNRFDNDKIIDCSI